MPIKISGELVRDGETNSALVPTGGANTGYVLGKASAANNDTTWVENLASITFVIDGAGNTITTGVKGDIQVPFPCVIKSWSLVADQSGNCVIDVWKDSFTNFPPVDADSITASAPPTLSSNNRNTNSTMTGWTTTISADDFLRYNVDSAAGVTRVTLTFKVRKT